MGRVAALGAASMLLAGCMASGVSSYLGDNETANSRQAARAYSDPAYTVPLDAAATGVVDARGGSSQPISLPSPYGAASYPAPAGPAGTAVPPTAVATARVSPYGNTASPYGNAARIAQPLPGVQAGPALPNGRVDTVATAAVSTTNTREMSGAGGIGQPQSLYSLAPQPAALNDPALQRPPGVTDVNPVPAIDPLEAAAEQRIPAIHASIDHGQCKGGWGPKPKMVNAKRIDPAHPYYMEMRLRHTPPLPIGHVYIAYGRIGPDGEPLDEKLVMLAPLGGYAGAAVAAAAPMPGVLTPHYDDCRQTPIAAYRISLSATQFEKLLLRIRQAKEKKPTYHLFQYNCNHFMSDVAKVVGILPPENLYKPSLVYFYEMMDRNEGRPVPREPTYAAAPRSQRVQNPVR